MQTFKDLIKNNILFDSHCHLNAYEVDLDKILKNAEENCVYRIIDISTDLGSAKKSLELSQKYEIVHSAVGIDPEVLIPGSDLYFKDFKIDQEIIKLRKMIRLHQGFGGQVIMIGEIGIDNYWLQKNKNLEAKEKQEILENQEELFRAQLELAEKFDLPVSIHSRDAVGRCIEIVKNYNVTGVFHSLTNETFREEDKAKDIFKKQVEEILDLGFYVGINGIVSYNSANLIREVFLEVYNNRKSSANSFLESLYTVGFVLETDGPFLVPSGFKTEYKRVNEPAAVKFLLDFMDKSF